MTAQEGAHFSVPRRPKKADSSSTKTTTTTETDKATNQTEPKEEIVTTTAATTTTTSSSSATVTALRKLSQALLQQDQYTTSTGTISQSSSSSSNYISNLVNKSGVFLGALKDQYASYLTAGGGAGCGERAGEPAPGGCQQDGGGAVSAGRKRGPGCVKEGSSDPARTTMTTGNNMQSSLSTEETRGASSDGSNGGGAGYPAGPASSFSLPSLWPRSGPMVTSRQPLAELTSTSENASRTTIDGGKDEEDQHRASATATSANQQAAPSKARAGELIGGGGTLVRSTTDDGSPWVEQAQRSISGQARPQVLSNYCSNHSQEQNTTTTARTNNNNEKQQWRQEGSSRREEDEERGEGGEEVAGRRGSRRNMTNPYGDLTAISDNANKQQQQLQLQLQQQLPQSTTDDVRNRDNQFGSMGDGGQSAALPSPPPPMPQSPMTARPSEPSQSSGDSTMAPAEQGDPNGCGDSNCSTPRRPPLPPPPPREILQAVAARSAPTLGPNGGATTSTTNTNTGQISAHKDDSYGGGGSKTAGTTSGGGSSSTTTSGHQQPRRYALQEHSLERDAALSFKVVHAKELKHKRTSSIKSVLRHAHLGPLRPSTSKRAAGKAAREAAGALAALASHPGELGCKKSTSGGSGANKAPKSMPYELFEPPVTQRTVERSKRRGAMASQLSATTPGDSSTTGGGGGSISGTSAEAARRQLSFDTIGLRQLTDEYLQNAGLKQPAGASMVALSEPTNTRQPSAKPGTIAVPGGSSTVAAVVAATVGNSADPSAAAASQAHCALEAQLYQATREAAAKLESDYYQDQYGNYLCCSSSLGTTSSSQPGSAGGGGGGLRNHPQHSHQNQKLTNSAGSLERHDRPGPRSNLYYQDNPITSSSSANTSEVTVLPGQLPWQSDVSIQCELLQAPTTLEPYETTGDILNTITRPFRGPPLNNYSHTISFESSSSHHHHHHHHAHGQHHHHHHLSATLKRGLSAISQHHLSPGGSLAGSMALNVVGSLKKSISNTFDVGPKAPISSQQQQQQQQSGQHTHTHHHHHHQLASLGQTLNLRSDDSLPAYASLNNEPDDESAGSSNSDQHHHHHYPQQQQLQSPASHHQAQAASGGGGGASEQQQQLQQSGLIGQLASKLSRQSSKKFTEGKRGLQRALSFDCRGYKRLDAAGRGQSTITGAGSGVRQQTSVTQTSADSTCSSLGSNGGPSSAMGAAKSLAAGTSSSSNGQQLLAARQRVHNKSTLALQSPRPYLPQSASQVDFQVPLLPYERMQEAIVSQRLLEPPQVSSPSSVGGGGGLGSGNDHQDQQQQQQRIQSTGKQPDADELICGGGGHSVTGFGDNQRAGARSNFMERNPAWNLDDNMARNDDDQKEEDREEAPGPAAPPSTPQLKARSSQQRETTTRLASGESLVTNEAALMGAPTGSELALAYQRQDTMTRSERGTPPRLVLNIPTISTAHGSSTSETNEFELELGPNDAIEMAAMGGGGGSSGGGPEENTAASAVGAGANQAASGGGQATTVITCLPSPSAQLEPSGSFELGLPSSGQLSQSPSFCLDAAGASSGGQRGTESNLLTASDVFRRSKNFIKRPSTMMASDEAEDAMNQVAAALGQATSMKQQADLSTNGSIRRNRRQAIVPPKLATDACCTSSESESCQPQVGRLVDLDDDREPNSVGRLRQPASRGERRQRYYRESSSMDEFCAEEEAQLSTIRRKRSGGGIEKLPSNATGAQPAANSSQAQQQQQRAPSAAVVTSQSNTNAEESRGPLNLPTFQIEDPQSTTMSPATGIGLAAAMGLNHHHQQPSERPDSQATNADSIVSSESTVSVCMGPGRGPSPFGGVGSSGAPSPNGTCGASSYGSAAGSLAVPFTSGSSSRRRSSIAVIPQMQICPGDLLVYSKQLIDRMNQTDENEPPQFLTIDEKKGKNIWSSFKLCAQFDNRTMRARNELLCSLEDVLVSLQPSTFVDEQLSHYKGMLWNEFLCETESRRSASSEAMSGNEDSAAATNENENDTSGGNRKKKSYKDELIDSIEVRVEGPSPVNGTLPDGQEVMVPQTSSTGTSNSAKPPLPHEGHRRAGSMRGDELSSSATKSIMAHEGVKTTMSTGGSGASAGQTTSPQRTSGDKQQQGLTNGQPQQRTISSRFREKPKLKRGQTVDSVFRIPLIPSSPLKHAQQHQQTPTAHLEDHDLNTIEDDERSSMGSANSGGGGSGAMNDDQHRSMFGRRKRSSSTRSRSSGRPDERVGCEPTAPAVSSTTIGARSGTSQGEGANSSNKSLGNCGPQQSPSQDSSFDTEDARDLMEGPNAGGARSSRRSPTTPNQLVRQTSLSTLSSTITRTEQKRQRALWDLFQSECTFFFDHLLTLKNVYMEPLKKIQVEGFAMFADPDVLFGNLDELCCGVYDFCKEFLYIIMRTLKTRPEELNATDVLIKLYKKNPKIDHLRAVYHRYTLNYINALTYLDSLRRQVEFVEFEKWSSRDVRCKKLQLTDLLVAPVQHIMRVPIILKDIEAHTENVKDREEIRAILAVEEASLRELDDKMRWLKNFERLLEIQKNIQWPSVFDMEPKLYVPEFLKEVLSKQPCEKLIVSPKRQIVHEGTLSNLDLNGKASDMHVILFDDMLLMTRRKKQLTKKSSTVCKTNSSGGQHSSGSHSASSMLTDDGTFKYVVYKQPLSLDRFYVHDVQQVDSQSIGIKHLFLLIVMNRFQQIINIHSFAAPNDDMKQTWLFKIKKTAERWKRINSSSSSSSQHQQQQQQQQKQQQQQQHHHHNHHQQSRNLHQEPPVAQQPGISTSKSMPMTQSTQPQATAQAGSSMVSRSPAAQAQQSTSHHTANVQQGAPPMASQGRHNDSKSTSHHQRQGGGSGGVWVHGTGLGVQQPQAPIEFVITSASESPASEQQKCR